MNQPDYAEITATPVNFSVLVEPIEFDRLLSNLRQMEGCGTRFEPWMPAVWRLAEEIQEIKERWDS